VTGGEGLGKKVGADGMVFMEGVVREEGSAWKGRPEEGDGDEVVC